MSIPQITALLVMNVYAFSGARLREEPPKPVEEKLIRETVDAVATVLRREYFDPAVATKTADSLQTRVTQGRYAETKSVEHLAETLTRDLLQLTDDKHLVVAVVRQLPKQHSATVDSRVTTGRRSNFGVQRVEVLPGNIGYLNLTMLYRPEEASEEIAASFRVLRHADALILDLRDNGGGSPNTAALVLSYFFEKEELPLFEIVERSGKCDRYTTESSALPDRNGKRPLFVLTSKRTFSAGEGLAFLLQERNRAEVIGERTAGAANPGRAYSATPLFDVTVPNGKVRSSISGENWEGRGVTPDRETAADDALHAARVRALRRLLEQSASDSWTQKLRHELESLENANATAK